MAGQPTAAGIASRALALVEHNVPVDAVGDGTQEGDEAALHWDAARRQVIGAARWHFAKEYIQLDGILAGVTTPTSLPNVYQLPAGVIRVLALPNVTEQIWRVAGKTNRLHTIHDAPLVIEAMIDVTDPTRFEPDFVTALELLMAHRMAPRFSRSQNRAEILFRRYEKTIEAAAGNEAAEGGDDIHDSAADVDWRDVATPASIA